MTGKTRYNAPSLSWCDETAVFPESCRRCLSGHTATHVRRLAGICVYTYYKTNGQLNAFLEAVQ